MGRRGPIIHDRIRRKKKGFYHKHLGSPTTPVWVDLADLFHQAVNNTGIDHHGHIVITKALFTLVCCPKIKPKSRDRKWDRFLHKVKQPGWDFYVRNADGTVTFDADRLQEHLDYVFEEDLDAPDEDESDELGSEI